MLKEKKEDKKLDMLCSNQRQNALNMNRGLLIQYIDQRKSENTLRKFAVASKWGNFIRYFTESRVSDSSFLDQLAERNCLMA